MDNYDTPWKTALMRYFPDFMAFYFPAAHKAINWNNPARFLDQELAQVCPDACCGTRRLDKLVEVTALAGGPRLLYVHIEVQRSRDSNFCERIYTYHYRLYDRFRCPIASMALLADDSKSWRPNCFSYECLGCTASLQFPIVKLMDFLPLMDELPSNENPFALVTAAHLMTMQTIHAPHQPPRSQNETGSLALPARLAQRANRRLSQHSAMVHATAKGTQSPVQSRTRSDR